MVTIDLTTTSSLNGGGIDVTIHEDTNNDGTSDNSDTIPLAGGTGETNTSADVFSPASGNDYWLVVDMTVSSETSDAPTLDSASIDTGSVTAVTLVTDLPDASQPTLNASMEDEITATIDDVTNYGDYRFQIRETGESTWSGSAAGFAEATEPSVGDTSGDVSHTFAGPEDGEEYEVRVRTETEHVTGGWTSPVSATTILPAPSGLTAGKPYAIQVDGSSYENVSASGIDIPDEFTLAVTIEGETTDQVDEYIYTLGWESKINLTHLNEDGTDRLGLEIRNAADDGHYFVTNPVSHLDGDEHTVVATVGGDGSGGYEVTIYLDGTATVGANISDHLTGPGHDVWFTAAEEFYGTFTGIVDNPVIDDRPWSAAEAAAYDDGEVPSDVRHFWPLDEGSGTTATDVGTGSIDATAKGDYYVERNPETGISLSWTDEADNEDGQRIYRARKYPTGFSNFEEMADLAAGVEGYVDPTVSPDRTYKYKVEQYTEHSTSSTEVLTTTTNAGVPQNKDIPAEGWYVEVEHPDRGDPVTPAILDDPQWMPRLNDQPRVSIPVPRDESWLAETWEDGQTMRVWRNGERMPIEKLNHVEMRTGRTVLVGIGGVQLEQHLEEFVKSEPAHSYVETLIPRETTYAINVDDPAASVTSDVEMRSVESTNDWQTALPPIADSDPWDIENGELRPLKTCIFSEGEDESNASGGTSAQSPAYSGEWAHRLSNTGDWVEYSLTTSHVIPGDHVGLNLRLEASEFPSATFYLNGTEVDSLTHSGGQLLLGWDDVSEGEFESAAGWPGDDLPAGTHTVRIEVDDGQNDAGVWLDIDCVALYDQRYDFTFDNTVDGNFALAGPAPYADEITVETVDVVSAEQVIGGELTSSWSNAERSQAVGISNDQGGTWHDVSNSQTVSASFNSGSGQIRARFVLSSGNDGTRTSTPLKGTERQTVSNFTLSADLDDTPLLINKIYDDSLLSVLKQIADEAGQIWEMTRDESGTIQIDWTTPGERTDDRSETVLDYSVEKENLRPYDEVVVQGSAQTRSNEQFESNHDSFEKLDKSNLREGSESVYDPDATPDPVVFDRGADYEMDYQAGKIKALSTGDMSDTTNYLIDYRWEVRGSHPTEGLPDDPRTRVVNIPAATGERECGQLALSIYKDIQEPLYSIRIVLDTVEAGTSLLDDVLYEGVPTDGTRAVIRSIEQTPGRVTLDLGSRESVGDVVADIRSRLASLSKRV